jgi:hypothetical protein
MLLFTGLFLNEACGRFAVKMRKKESGSDVNLNFDEGGISAITGNKFYYGNENTAVGIYELFVGTTGGSVPGAASICFTIQPAGVKPFRYR